MPPLFSTFWRSIPMVKTPGDGGSSLHEGRQCQDFWPLGSQVAVGPAILHLVQGVDVKKGTKLWEPWRSILPAAKPFLKKWVVLPPFYHLDFWVLRYFSGHGHKDEHTFRQGRCMPQEYTADVPVWNLTPLFPGVTWLVLIWSCPQVWTKKL